MFKVGIAEFVRDEQDIKTESMIRQEDFTSSALTSSRTRGGRAAPPMKNISRKDHIQLKQPLTCPFASTRPDGDMHSTSIRSLGLILDN